MTYLSASQMQPSFDEYVCWLCRRADGVNSYFSENGGYKITLCYRCLEVLKTLIRQEIKDQ